MSDVLKGLFSDINLYFISHKLHDFILIMHL